MTFLRQTLLPRSERAVRPLWMAVALTALALLADTSSTHAATIQVTTTADEFATPGPGSGCSLREAIRSANADADFGGCTHTGAYGADTIRLPGGTYTLTIAGRGEDQAATGDLDVLSVMTIQRIDDDPVTVDADGIDRVIHVLDNGNLTLTGLTVTGGVALSDFGGGIRNDGTLTLTDVTVTGNSTSAGGGGIRNGGWLTVTDSIISDNAAGTTASGGGGGIHNTGSVALMTSILSGNSTTADGGAIRNQGTLAITGSTMSGNSATHGNGGGIYNVHSTVTVTGSILSGNSAAYGGGIRNFRGMVTITGSILDGNSATNGGGILTDDATLTLTNSTLSGNSATEGGGLLTFGTATVTNVTLSGNSATSNGGGIYSTGGGTLTVTNSTLSGNSSPDGGGIRAIAASAVRLRATLLDTGASGANCSISGATLTSLGSNLSDDGTCGLAGTGDQNDVALLLGPLAYNGGEIQNHALLDGSPAIDAVQGACTSDGTGGGAVIAADQRGLPRPAGLRCDAGAFERQGGSLRFSSATYSAGEGTGAVVVAISRTGGSEGTVGATVTIGDGTAVAPHDYSAVNGPVSFADGETARSVSILVASDTVDEPDETVNLTLSNPVGGAALGTPAAAMLTILDDDAPPTLSIAGASVTEGNAATGTVSFTVSLSGQTSRTVTVQYATADGTAKAGSDYTATNGTLTFAPGQTSKPIPVTILSDSLAEPDESFTLTLSNPTNAVLGIAQGVGTIQNDDVVVACGPRPRVTQTLSAGGGALAVHIEASPLNTSANNHIKSIRFGTFQNATVTFNGQAVTSGQTVTLPPNTIGADFTVRRVTPGQATTVPFTVSDSCGSWDTFVGGGAGAGF